MINAHSKKILVVDDDADIRDILTIILELEGYAVTGLDNGHGVRQTIQEDRPDLLLLDVRLGDMDGRDICKDIKDDPGTTAIPIIMISATHGRPGPGEQPCGADDYLPKPFKVDELIEHVRRLAA